MITRFPYIYQIQTDNQHKRVIKNQWIKQGGQITKVPFLNLGPSPVLAERNCDSAGGALQSIGWRLEIDCCIRKNRLTGHLPQPKKNVIATAA